MDSTYLDSIHKQFAYYKQMGDKVLERVPEEKLFWQYNPESNSIAIIVQHLRGNMRSRWTDFLTTDGEKEWRRRDAEFEKNLHTKVDIIAAWEDGWQCLFTALDSLTETDLGKIVYIRNLGHTVSDAINRQLAHYPYHVGQMVFIGKMVTGSAWDSLSIPKGKSAEFNDKKFSGPKQTGHFTDEYVKE